MQKSTNLIKVFMTVWQLVNQHFAVNSKTLGSGTDSLFLSLQQAWDCNQTQAK